MSTPEHVVLMASYNAWMNGKAYAAAATLPESQLTAPRGAFFSSIIGTLNHLVVGDTVWLHRFRTHPSPKAALAPIADIPLPAALDAIVFHDFAALTAHRERLDAIISAWAAELTEDDLAFVLPYANMRGVKASRRFSSLVMHFFNHQTHHRGQVTTLLSQAGADVGVTDLLMLIPDQSGEQVAP